MLDLKTLLDENCKLLEKFKSLAPGTYQHCNNVSKLCGTIGKELGFNVDMLKVAGLYHDVGKMWNPLYFSENISDENPHDKLKPEISYQILTRHVSDSALILLGEIVFPKEIIKVISEHHGDTILYSIAEKSKNSNKELFRYQTPRPSTSESAILMIVDSVEATAKAKYAVDKLETKEQKISLVDNTIKRLKADKQLDEMKVGVLRKVEEILCCELDSTYHNRIPYGNEEEIIDE